MIGGIAEIISQGELPSDSAPLLEHLTEPSGQFISQEGSLWDFKREWPFSYSDSYFCGIARLICAFANSNGGLIIFGVHDEHRTGGHNRVSPNMDRLQQALNQLLSDRPTLALRKYNENTANAIDVLLVSPKSPATMPLRFARESAAYKANVIWVRQGHEVVAAEPRHLAMLYCRDDTVRTQDGETDSYLSGGLPPSPATIKKFVGRMRTIDQVFRWLRSADEPRTFLYGKGGSGKTTIAYEVAKTIKLIGGQFGIHGDILDNIIFVSAKQRSLDVMNLTSNAFVGLDFSNERELYEAILTLGNWSSQSMNDLSLNDLRGEIKGLFDLTSNFVVIDDIDTLTVNGLEAGFDFLYGILWRAKRKSKLLYTLRNAPSQSLANAIEVPGLEEGDYEEFVEVCRSQFRVQAPPERSFVSGRLSIVSERRPLVIESIIALARTAGSYNRAVELFEEGAGEDVRRYVFQREWNSLSPTNHGRYVLAVLALNAEPMGFSDLVALTRYEERRVRDALADVREMFLIVNEIGEEATYQLGEMTRSFVLEQSKNLDQYAAIKERVTKYRIKFFPGNPILSRLRDRVETLVYRGWKFSEKDALKKALGLISDDTLSPKITEDPRFNSLQAFVYASQQPPQLDDARNHFARAFVMKFEPDIEHLKSWYFAEKNSGHGLEQCLRIADLICQGKKYDDDTKQIFLSRKASLLFNRGRENIYFDPSRGLADLEMAMTLHLSSYEKAYDSGNSRLDKIEEYTRNSAYVIFQFLASNQRLDDLVETILRISDGTSAKLDPLEDPIARAVDSFLHVHGSKADLQRLAGRLDYLGKRLASPSRWHDRFACGRLQDHIKVTTAALNSTIGKIAGRKSY